MEMRVGGRRLIYKKVGISPNVDSALFYTWGMKHGKLGSGD